MDKLVVSLRIVEAPAVPLLIGTLIMEVEDVPLIIIEAPVVPCIQGRTL